MSDTCTSCNQKVSPHFTDKGISQCMTCVSIKVGFGSRVRPDSVEKERNLVCVLCTGSVSDGLPRSLLCESCLQVIEIRTGLTYSHFYRNSSQPWLVKSGGFILGPLSSGQVEEKIRNKEIGLFDLVQKPYGRWHYAREEEAFKTVVEDVRSRPAARDDTVALTVTEVTDVGDLQSDIREGERTVEALDDLVDLPTERYERRPAARTFRNFLLVGFLLIAGSGLLVLLNLSSQSSLSDDDYRKLVADGRNAFNIGNFSEARINFRRAATARELGFSYALDYIALLIDQGLLSEADEMLQKMSSKTLGSKDKAQVLVLTGLKHLSAGDTGAAEGAFVGALEADRLNEVAVFNLANVYLLKGEPERALDTLQTVENPSSDFELWKFQMVEATASKIRTHGSSPEAVHFTSTVGDLDGPRPYISETHLVLAFLYHKTGNDPAAIREIENVIKSEPEITENSHPNLWLFRRRSLWSSLELYCSEIKDTLSDPTLAMKLWSYCQTRSGESAKGRDLALELHLKNEKDWLAKSILAYGQLKTGNYDQAEVLLKDQNLKTPFEFWILAKACESTKSQSCLDAAVNKLLDMSPRSPFAISEKVKASQQDEEEARRWIEVGRERAWYYQPIRQLEFKRGGSTRDL